MTSHKPYKIDVQDADIVALKARLAGARFPDELDGAGWAYGSPLSDIKRLVTYWRTSYDWKKHEAEINETLL